MKISDLKFLKQFQARANPLFCMLGGVSLYHAAASPRVGNASYLENPLVAVVALNENALTSFSTRY